MRLVKLAGNAVTVELLLTDCVALVSALHEQADGMNNCDTMMLEALAAAFLGHGFAAFLLGLDSIEEKTIANFWATWAPLDTHARPMRQIAMPHWLIPVEANTPKEV